MAVIVALSLGARTTPVLRNGLTAGTEITFVPALAHAATINTNTIAVASASPQTELLT